MILIIATAIWVCACDCTQNASGTVLDQKTKKVLKDVYVQKVTQNYVNTYTDNLGNFELDAISGFSCSRMEVALTKEGYEIKLVEIKNRARDTIYLERVQ